MSPQFLLDSTIFTLNIMDIYAWWNSENPEKPDPFESRLIRIYTANHNIATFITTRQEYKCSGLNKGLTPGHLTDE